jgi:acetyl-CoA acetyltransferase
VNVPTIYPSAAAMFRISEGLGVWPYRGQVAAVGIGHAPTMRRWDGDPATTVGAWSVLAVRKAIADAGVTPDQVDGLVMTRDTTTGGRPQRWPTGEPVPADFLAAFENTSDPEDGLAHLSPEWLIKNLPELTNLKFVMVVEMDLACMSMVLAAAIEAVGRGMANICIAVKGWHNFAGRYHQGGNYAGPTIAGGPWKYGHEFLAGYPSYPTVIQFRRYMHKYGKTHEMMAPFVVNSRANGLLFPEGYWAQHRPVPLTIDDYLQAPLILKPANLLDHDLPIQTAGAYLITTAERAKDMAQKPVYILGHAGTAVVDGDFYGELPPRSIVDTLEEVEERTAATARKVYEAAGVKNTDIQFENTYDGFSMVHVYHIEGFQFAGIKNGEALDLFQTDISIHGPHPVSPSGGNIGGGRTRFWMHTDCIQQIQGRAGARAMTGIGSVQCGLSGAFATNWNNFIVWSSTPD